MEKGIPFEMTVPRAGFFASLVGAALIEAGVLRADPGFAVLLIVMAAMWLFIDAQRGALARHQRLLAWFVDHVYSADEVKGRDSDAPQELKDLVNRE